MDQHGSATDGTAHTGVIVVRLPEELREALRQQAAREDRTLASLLRLAARAYLNEAHQGAPSHGTGTVHGSGADATTAS